MSDLRKKLLEEEIEILLEEFEDFTGDRIVNIKIDRIPFDKGEKTVEYHVIIILENELGG